MVVYHIFVFLYFCFKFISSNVDKVKQEQVSKTESHLKTAIGSHQFKINNYSHIWGIGNGKYVESDIFTIGGYNWAIRLYPDDIHPEESGYISIYLEFKSNAGEARAKYSLYLLDHAGTPFYQQNCTLENYCCFSRLRGYHKFLRGDTLQASACLSDNSFTIACDVVVVKEPRTALVPPSDIHERLSHLLSTGIGADVAFEVNGEVLDAHRCILAASSSVFQAELYGSMKERETQTIKIRGMDASVFKSMIYFMYNDSLPDINKANDATMMFQQLLVAADRYGVERLRLTCEEELCNGLDMSNVGTILALAEQHSLIQLENACLQYFSAPKTLVSAEETTKHEHFVNCEVALLS